MTIVMNTMVWMYLFFMVFCTDTQAYNAVTIRNILQHLPDCKFNSAKVQNGALRTSKAVMKNGLFLAFNTENVSLLTLDDNMALHNQSYFSKFKLCQNVLVTNTDAEKLKKVLSNSNISVNAGIFKFAIDNFGIITQWYGIYKTHNTSKSLQIYHPDVQDEKHIWIQRSNLHGIDFEAISA